MITPSLALMLLVAALAIVFIFGTIAALRRGDGWRWIAGLPFLLVLGVVTKIVVDVNADPTAHNLWPFEVLAALVVAVVALGAIRLLRFIIGRWAGRAGAR